MHGPLDNFLICLQMGQTACSQRNVTSPSGPSRISLGHGREEIWVLHPFSVPFGYLGLAFLVHPVLMEGPATVSDVLVVNVESHGWKETEQTCATQTREAHPPLVVLPQPSAAT